MKKLCCLALIVFAISFASSSQNLTEKWKSIYTDSTAGLLHVNDAVVDSNGNSYLAGYKIFTDNFYYYETHFFLMKVNAQGTQEWIRYFDNKFDSIDAAIAIALDASGNIYLTSTRIDTFCNICTYSSKISDIITMKYDGAGNRLWLNRYHDSIYKLAVPTDITVSATGTIIVTGSDDTKAFVEKINTDGRTIWKRKIKDITANTACFDNDGNIIVGGASDPYHLYQTQKPMVMKLSAAGDFLWSDTFDEFEKNGRIFFVACTAENAVYANGQTDTNAFNNNPKILTLKYNSKGQRKWFRKEEDNSYIQQSDYGDFKLDASGNVYITGYINRSSINDDWIVTKYNSQGKKQWISYYDDSVHASDRSCRLVINKEGIVYVTGYSPIKNTFNITTLSYDNNGNKLTEDIFKTGRPSGSFASGIGLDKEGNIYVQGELGFRNSDYPSLVVIKYKAKQNDVFSKSSLPVINQGLKIFPNPVSSSINITFTTSASSKKYNLIISDMSGNIMLTRALNNSDKIFNLNLNVQQLKPGSYTTTISDGINTISKTFIKQ